MIIDFSCNPKLALNISIKSIFYDKPTRRTANNVPPNCVLGCNIYEPLESLVIHSSVTRQIGAIRHAFGTRCFEKYSMTAEAWVPLRKRFCPLKSMLGIR